MADSSGRISLTITKSCLSAVATSERRKIYILASDLTKIPVSRDTCRWRRYYFSPCNTVVVRDAQGRSHEGACVIEEGVKIVEQARENGYDTVWCMPWSWESNRALTGGHGRWSQTEYEASKLARERYAEYFANRYDMSMIGMRFFSEIRAMMEPRDERASTWT